MRALVLSGGGSKGAYQIGVWKALKKLNIKFDIVTGTSAGAINGALITQNSYHKAVKVWKKLSYQSIFGEDFESTDDIKKLYKTFAKNFITEGGTCVDSLEKLINKNININKFYKSKINYGLVTYNYSNKKPIQLEKKDIQKEYLGKYILASASCFPAFQKMKIKENEYIDGGYYDNLPINLAIKMGATEAIIVDLKAIGIKKKAKKKIKQIVIQPNNDLCNFLVFDKHKAKRNMIYGYNDTLKVFNKLEGKKYTFKKNELKKAEIKYKSQYQRILFDIFKTEKQVNKFKQLLTIEKKEQLKKELITMIIEDIGYKYKIDDTKIYSCYSFNRELKKKFKKELFLKKDNSIIKFYMLLKNKNYIEIRKEAILRPFDLIRAIYIYITLED